MQESKMKRPCLWNLKSSLRDLIKWGKVLLLPGVAITALIVLKMPVSNPEHKHEGKD